jgi:hypothetical protein
MRRHSAPTGFAILALSLAVFANGSPLLAQAGSTGGTVGKTDKSISGGNEAERHAPAKPRAKRERPTDRADRAVGRSSGVSVDGCAKLPRVWSWFVNGDVTIKAGGTLSQPQSKLTGTWTCKNNDVVMFWSHGFTDRLSLSRDGTHLEGSNGIIAVTGDRK